MKLNKYFFLPLFVPIICVTICSNQLHAQFLGKKVAYLTTQASIDAGTDKPIADKLKSWGFTVDFFNESDFRNASSPVPTNADLLKYNLLFVSEFVGSGNIARLRGATAGTWTTGWLPIPCVNTDNWTSRVSALGFVPASAGYGNIGSSTVTIVNDKNHPLCAGFAHGAQLDITNGTTSTDPLTQYTYVTPDPKVNVIPIAALTTDLTKLVVLGVETGTEVYNSTAVFGGATKTTARYAAVGINQTAFPNITNDGFTMIQGAISWALQPVTDVTKETVVPSTFSLKQNFPNPFNPTTSIQYTIPTASHVTLKVMNILGQVVATLVNEQQEAGTHPVTFDASKLTSGVYFYEVNAGNFTATKKMILMK